MPAIASIEDLRAAQEEGLGIYAMLYGLWSMLYENGVKSAGKIFASFGWKKAPQNN